MPASSPSEPRTVDVHAHVLFPELMGLAGAAGPEMGVADGQSFFRSGSYVLRGVRFVDSPFSDLDRRIDLMDRLGIDLQLLSPNPLTYFYGAPVADAQRFCAAQNDLTAAAIARYPGRFGGFAQLPMQSPEAAVDELERAVTRLGLVGSYIGSSFAGVALEDRSLEPVWSAHERLGVQVVVHPEPIDLQSPAEERDRRYDLDIVIGFAHDETAAVARLLFGGVLDRHPRLQVHVPHGGGTAPYLKGRMRTAIERRPWAKGLLTRPFDALWSQLSFDCLLGTDEALDFLVRSEGADRVMLGTNFAGWDQADDIVARVQARFDGSVRDRILAGTAMTRFRRVA
ncbi:amidohydrolase family protein [Pseudorhodoferax soli]|uniref:Aminocarboxymuconate-semialdehyde decarboxylase n=1 Tax=Pseudorhodoferax soli TaxID=545864 RepID=A0A368XL44_9BURK|nr:amidohydrolase family protein [Pseudorhodoferax soli]RCW68630.1 aminocarboxymuconate-semialdehyde decarboxylase [Pseudorhodoferax soli]